MSKRTLLVHYLLCKLGWFVRQLKSIVVELDKCQHGCSEVSYVVLLWAHPTPQTLWTIGSEWGLCHLGSNCESRRLPIQVSRLELRSKVIVG